MIFFESFNALKTATLPPSDAEESDIISVDPEALIIFIVGNTGTLPIQRKRC